MKVLQYTRPAEAGATGRNVANSPRPAASCPCPFSDETCSGTVFRYVVVPLLAAIPLAVLAGAIYLAIQAMRHNLPWF